MQHSPVGPTAKGPSSASTGDVSAEGHGLVGTRDGVVVHIRPGETVVIDPGEDHWHGATADTPMAHYALLEVDEDGSDPTTWKEPVTDEQYRAAHEESAR